MAEPKNQAPAPEPAKGPKAAPDAQQAPDPAQPAADQAVRVTPVTTPVRHDGVLHEIGKPFEALWHEVEHLVAAGIAKLEALVGGKTASKGK